MTGPRHDWQTDRAHIGRRILDFESLPSTNDEALARAEAGTVIVAETQTAGRGQFGRAWTSPAGAALLATVTVDAEPVNHRAAVLIAWAAVAIAESIESLIGLPVIMKWPNDLLVGPRKVCGILTERQSITAVGFGINLNQTLDDFLAAELPGATSLAMLTGHGFDALPVLAQILNRLDDSWARMLAGDYEWLERNWSRRLGLCGRTVIVETVDGLEFTATLGEVSFEGLEFPMPDGPSLILAPERVRHLRVA
jgi:BirA family transcriptional regulator, biotin operon repressor / biotin---[acetyl-CoA-carboxylase] ligase